MTILHGKLYYNVNFTGKEIKTQEIEQPAQDYADPEIPGVWL